MWKIMFDRITTTLRILHHILQLMVGFYLWVVVCDICSTIGCGYNFLVRCMYVIILHTGLPNRLIYYVLRHVNNDVGLQCLVPILVHYLFHHHGDILGEVGVVCRLFYGGISRNIFDDVAANKQYRMRQDVHNAHNTQQGREG
jgi:hypothetical protein